MQTHGKNNLLSPIKQVLTNEAWYGDDIVPSRLQGEKNVANKVDESTDFVSKGIGKLLGSNEFTNAVAQRINLNPITINYLLDQYSGAVGDTLLPFMTPEAEVNPIASKFSTDSTMNSKYPSEYYETLDKLKSNNSSSDATDEDKLKYKYFNSDSSTMSDLYKQKREVSELKISNEAKRVELKEIQTQINDIAKNKLEDLNSLEIKDNIATIGDKTYYKNSDGSWTELKEALPVGLSASTYGNFKSLLTDENKEAKEETGKELTEKEKNKLLEAQNYSDKEKQLLYSVTTGKDDSTYHSIEILNNGKVSSDYMEYIKKSQDNYFTNKDEETGKEVTGQKQDRLIDFLQNSNLTDIEMYYIYAKEGYACSKNGKGLKKAQRDKLRKAIEDQKLKIDKKAYESMIKELDEADEKAKKWGVD